MSNLFFFRDKNGYELEDKYKRVRSKYFNLENDVIAEWLEEHNLDTEDLDNPGKHRLRHFFEKNLEDDLVEELIDDLFNEYGEHGDTFNIKAYSLDSEIEEELLIEKLESFEDEPIMTTDEEGNFSYLFETKDFIDREESEVVDISFHVTGKREMYPADEMFLQTEEGEKRSIEELLYDEDVFDEPPDDLSRTQDYTVEVRIYSEAGLMAVSNSDIDKTLQAEIRSGIQRWGSDNGSR